jgi:hypothetical protein
VVAVEVAAGVRLPEVVVEMGQLLFPEGIPPIPIALSVSFTAGSLATLHLRWMMNPVKPQEADSLSIRLDTFLPTIT